MDKAIQQLVVGEACRTTKRKHNYPIFSIIPDILTEMDTLYIFIASACKTLDCRKQTARCCVAFWVFWTV